MKVESVELRQLRIPLASPFETSGWREEEKTCIIVGLRSGPLAGFGECAVSRGPWYSYETTHSAWHIMEEYIVPSVLGREFKTPGELLDVLSSIRGHNMAKAAFEMAFWDLVARERGVSLSKMLGGASSQVVSGVSVGIQESVGKLVDMVEKFLDRGYRRIKVKIKPGLDVKLVAALREEFPDTPLMVDANAAYRSEDMERLVKLDQFELLMIEQPFAWDDLVDHASLQKVIRTPVCLDESVAGLSDLKAALALESCRVLNIKPARVGGLTVARMMHDVCLSHRIAVWCGGLLETGVGRAHNVALASLPGFVMPNDISASDRWFKEDIVEPEFVLNPDGTINVPVGPGIGVEVLEDRLDRYTREKKRFKA
ncbi:MAG TPA: o-succinylbenzoate synthase [Candidatus Bathyarchaeia archaeon]